MRAAPRRYLSSRICVSQDPDEDERETRRNEINRDEPLGTSQTGNCIRIRIHTRIHTVLVPVYREQARLYLVCLLELPTVRYLILLLPPNQQALFPPRHSPALQRLNHVPPSIDRYCHHQPGNSFRKRQQLLRSSISIVIVTLTILLFPRSNPSLPGVGRP